MKKFYCIKCGEQVSYIENNIIRKHEYKSVVFEVNESVKKCAICGGELFDEEEEEKILNTIYNQYLSKFGLSFEQIRKIRQGYDLSQELFSKLMHWSKKTVTRYENMQSIPQGEYFKSYLELNKNKNKIYEFLSLNKKFLKEGEYKKITNSLEKSGFTGFKNEKLKNAILYFLSKKELYITQLVKYLFASDFLSYKKYGFSITGSIYIKQQFGPLLKDYREIVNDLFRTGVIEISKIEIIEDVAGETKEIYKYKAIDNFDKDMFSDNEITILQTICTSFKNKSSKQLSDWSHNFIGWKETPILQTISYNYAEDFNL
ncbi:MAG: type II toxin-antitoxin system antitoxin SocA domain-containing protein [Bacilli bacterium]